MPVGGSFRRAIGGELTAAARRWNVCEIIAESWDPEDAEDVAFLEELASATIVHLHCLSLNPLGDAPSPLGLERARGWVHRLRVDHVSDHYAWTGVRDIQLGVFIPPIEAALVQVDRVRVLRDRLDVALVLENVALPSGRDLWAYHETLIDTCDRANVPILLDVENLRLDAASSGIPASSLLELYADARVVGYHVAGSDIAPLVLDTHRHAVPAETLELARVALRRRPAPVIYERDFALDAREIGAEVNRLESALEAS